MKHKLYFLPVIWLVLSFVLSSCAATPNTVNEPSSTEALTATEAAPTEIPSPIGGTFTYALANDADTLDPHQTTNGSSNYIMSFLYSSLVAKDSEGNTVPYLATSWEITEDGLTYTFQLREDVKFHNGDPLTAEDVAWTYTRQIAPETASPTASLIGMVESIQALDDYTVQFKLAEPNYYLIDSLAGDGYEGILNKAYVEESGEDYGRNPIGTGPFIFKEWVTGDHITLERNPDFVWGPAFTGGNPPNIQTLVFRIIPESSTIVAGLEAGEIDYARGEILTPIDIPNLEATGEFDIIRIPRQGIFPYVCFNLNEELFMDLKVRQAFTYATNKQAIMDIIVPSSSSVIQNGPLSASMEGYWAGIEQMGFDYDLEKAKALMLEAGYTVNADDMLEMDGEPLSLTLTVPEMDILIKTAEILQAQWKELGVDLELSVQEFGIAIGEAQAGNYDAMMMAIGFSNSEMLTIMFHSKNIGGINLSQLNEPELDTLLDKMETAVDPAEHLQAAQDAQKMIVEQAYILPMFSQVDATIISKRVKDYSLDSHFGFRLWNATIQP